MKKIYALQCKCCKEPFETTRTDKFYKDKSHQVPKNNANQYAQSKKKNVMTKDSLQTYKIYDGLLKNNPSIRKSKEFLRGAGAILGLYSYTDLVDNVHVQFLFDIAIIPDENHIILKRKQHA
jgi:hypothetical protein